MKTVRMDMFETGGRTGAGVRKTATLQKLERMNKALRHEEPDRVPSAISSVPVQA